jgi:indolepyruvate ferredoxin oxidoreductase
VTLPETDTLRRRLDEVSRPDANRYLDASAIARGLFGTTTTANVLMMGVAVQLGALPVDPAAIEKAIALNGVAVDKNIAAFRFGRQWVLRPDVVEASAGVVAPRIETVDQLIARLTDDLADYQDVDYARRFADRITSVQDAEDRAVSGSTRFTEVAARHLHKLMAYKDEYEVARLALLDESQERYRAVGGPDTEVTYRLHPPILRSMGMNSKIGFKRTAEPSFTALRAMKKLRGTMADPFRWAEVRKVERAMIPEFERAIDTIASRLTADNLDEAVAIAGLPDQVRGYEDIKLPRAKQYRQELASRLSKFG